MTEQHPTTDVSEAMEQYDGRIMLSGADVDVVQWQNLSEGDEVPIDHLPDSDMTPDGSLEMVDGLDGLGALYGDTCVTFRVSKLEVVDVTDVEEL